MGRLLVLIGLAILGLCFWAMFRLPERPRRRRGEPGYSGGLDYGADGGGADYGADHGGDGGSDGGD